MHDHSITGLILAGGKGARMGGVDKGLQNFNGTPLTLHALMRLQMQEGSPLSDIMIVANRNLSAYESLGVQVWPDSTDGFAGPLAGFLTGMERCESELLLTVPCDSPLFPLDLVQKLQDALEQENADIAVAAAKEEDGKVRPQPVFCLIRTRLLESLVKFMQSGGRKIDAWTSQHACVLVPFDAPNADPRAFFNANTLEELHRLEQTP
ncbi:MAG: Molybdenum cofactor guanylyltransferase [Pseudomonadota bacterium]